MKTITISTSLRFKELVRSTIAECLAHGVVALFPNPDGNKPKEDISVRKIRAIEQDHFEAIDASEALYVICPEGYVGTLVAVEIGYTHGRKKPIFFSELPSDLGLQALGTDIIPLAEIKKIALL